jgi:hypothetical protein
VDAPDLDPCDDALGRIGMNAEASDMGFVAVSGGVPLLA